MRNNDWLAARMARLSTEGHPFTSYQELARRLDDRQFTVVSSAPDEEIYRLMDGAYPENPIYKLWREIVHKVDPVSLELRRILRTMESLTPAVNRLPESTLLALDAVMPRSVRSSIQNYTDDILRIICDAVEGENIDLKDNFPEQSTAIGTIGVTTVVVIYSNRVDHYLDLVYELSEECV